MFKFRVQNLQVAYGRVPALQDVTIGIPSREIAALIGPSGSGKTTFLRALNRMNELVPGCRTWGRAELDGVNIYAPGTDRAYLRRRVGMVFQRPNPFPRSIFDNVAYGPRLHGIRRRDELAAIVELRLRQAALWPEVKNRLKAPALALSGGQQQRLCLARALAVEPEVLLMDEPTSALDPVAAAQLEELICGLKLTHTVIIVTHNLPQALRISDRMAFFLSGRLIESGITQTLFRRPKDPRTADYIKGRRG